MTILWIAILFNCAIIALDIFMIFWTWERYVNRNRKFRHTSYLAKSIDMGGGVHYVNAESVRLGKQQLIHDRAYFKHGLRSAVKFSVLYAAIATLLLWDTVTIKL